MSYYDDPDFADEYRRRDEEAIAWAVEEREREDDTIRARLPRAVVRPGEAPGTFTVVSGHARVTAAVTVGLPFPVEVRYPDGRVEQRILRPHQIGGT